MKSHPTFEDFLKYLMGEWTKIDHEIEHLKNGYGRKDLKFNISERKRKERIHTVAMSVNKYSTIVWMQWPLLLRDKLYFITFL